MIDERRKTKWTSLAYLHPELNKIYLDFYLRIIAY